MAPSEVGSEVGDEGLQRTGVEACPGELGEDGDLTVGHARGEEEDLPVRVLATKRAREVDVSRGGEDDGDPGLVPGGVVDLLADELLDVCRPGLLDDEQLVFVAWDPAQFLREGVENPAIVFRGTGIMAGDDREISLHGTLSLLSPRHLALDLSPCQPLLRELSSRKHQCLQGLIVNTPSPGDGEGSEPVQT